jgi:hypothetical protein
MSGVVTAQSRVAGNGSGRIRRRDRQWYVETAMRQCDRSRRWGGTRALADGREGVPR